MDAIIAFIRSIFSKLSEMPIIRIFRIETCRFDGVIGSSCYYGTDDNWEVNFD